MENSWGGKGRKALSGYRQYIFKKVFVCVNNIMLLQTFSHASWFKDVVSFYEISDVERKYLKVICQEPALTINNHNLWALHHLQKEALMVFFS